MPQYDIDRRNDDDDDNNKNNNNNNNNMPVAVKRYIAKNKEKNV
jgi:hypothetical protein